MATRAENDYAATPAREWFTAAELADMGLPGLPGDKRAINRRAADEGWKTRCDRKTGELLVRPADQRGGGLLYHVSLLPGSARVALAERGVTVEQLPPEVFDPAADAWRWYEAQTDKVKAEATRRLQIVSDVELLEGSGMTRTAAIAATSTSHGVGKATLWNWMTLVAGTSPAHRLPALAPRRSGGRPDTDIDPELWRLFRSDFARPEEPTLTLCYEQVEVIAKERGIALPSMRTFRRRLEKEMDPRVLRRLRKGAEAARRALPAQRRTIDHLHALECVNIDGHKFDVRVLSRDGKVMRPILLGIQDVRSSKVLAWRVCEVESAHHVRLVFADLFADYGIPVHCVLDNGRGFASKWITGAAKTRNRFKIKDEDPTGLLTALGIGIHWALPYHGQSKPIERAWRELTDRIARAAFVSGAYTGRSPMHKPANYGKREIEWDAFVQHVDRCIALHNARLGRRGRDYKGRSFDEVFAESYATAPIGKATPEQLRMALLAAEQKLASRQTGEIQLFGNRYWSEACSQLHGQRVTVRFDPDDLTKDVHLYDLDGRYLTSAQLWEDAQFLDAESAKKAGKFVAEQNRKVREGIEAEDLLTAAQVAAYQTGKPVAEVPEATVYRPVRDRGQTAAALKAAPAAAPATNEVRKKVFTALSLVRLDDD